MIIAGIVIAFIYGWLFAIIMICISPIIIIGMILYGKNV